MIRRPLSVESIVAKTLQRGKDNGELPKTINIKETASYFFAFYSGLQIVAKVNPDKKELFKTIDMGIKVLD